MKGEPVWHQACHCESCRLMTGTHAQAMLNCMPDTVTITGDVITASRAKADGSENVTKRKSCSTCGGTLGFYYADKMICLAGSVFDDQEFPPVQSHCLSGEAQLTNLGDNNPKYKMGAPALGYPDELNENVIPGDPASGSSNAASSFPDAEGHCYCGAVTVKCEGTPAVMAMCHCRSCRHWTGGYGNLATLWNTDKVTVTGEIKVYHHTPESISHRTFCAKCGGNVMNSHPKMDMQDVCGGILNIYPLDPSMHINYGERIIDMIDGKPKFKDTPLPMHGSGIMIDEKTGKDIPAPGGEAVPAEAAAAAE